MPAWRAFLGKCPRLLKKCARLFKKCAPLFKKCARLLKKCARRLNKCARLLKKCARRLKKCSSFNFRISLLGLQAYDTLSQKQSTSEYRATWRPRSSRDVHSVALLILGFRSWACRPTILYLKTKIHPNTESQGAPGAVETFIR